MSDPPRPKRGAVVAVDYGDKRTGLAACDAFHIAAIPVSVIVTTDREQLLEKIINAVDDRNATTLVLGLPLHMQGNESLRSRLVRELGASLKKRLPYVDIVEWDERCSTKEANSLLAAGGIHWRKRKGQIDAVAAVVILRSYMEYVRRNDSGGIPVPS